MNHSPFQQRIKRFVWLSGCLIYFNRASAQTGILVTYYNGTEQGFVITNSGKLSFDNQNLLLASDASSLPTTIPVSIIRKITFSAAVLPLRLLDISIQSYSSVTRLDWKTTQELNVSHYLIQRSVDARTFSDIGQINARNSSSINSYSFADEAPVSGLSYYRLKMMDADGSSTYSRILSVNRTEKALLTLVPNPATDYVYISGITSDKMDVKIVSGTGQIVLAAQYPKGTKIPIAQMTPGLYLVIVNNQPLKLLKK